LTGYGAEDSLGGAPGIKRAAGFAGAEGISEGEACGYGEFLDASLSFAKMVPLAPVCPARRSRDLGQAFEILLVSVSL
jgi:hypothetical protein